MVRTGNSKIDSLINHDLKDKLTHYQYTNESVDSALKKWADDQINFLDFEITYNINSILSLSISAEGCGAYCTFWINYYNYSAKTGLPLELSDILKIDNGFQEILLQEKYRQFEQQKKELKELYTDDTMLDQDVYEWALEYYNNCEASFDRNEFSIREDGIKIIQDCYLPHAIQNLTPVFNLSYSFSELHPYLKI